MVDRAELLLNLYQKRRHWYRDTRRLTSTRLMNERLGEIRGSISIIPVRKRGGEYKDYKRLVTEQKMIEIKRMIYEDRKKNGSLFVLRWLEESDFHSEKEESILSSRDRECLCVRQTLMLMSILYRNYDDSKLQSIVERCNKLLC